MILLPLSIDRPISPDAMDGLPALLSPLFHGLHGSRRNLPSTGLRPNSSSIAQCVLLRSCILYSAHGVLPVLVGAAKWL